MVIDADAGDEDIEGAEPIDGPPHDQLARGPARGVGGHGQEPLLARPFARQRIDARGIAIYRDLSALLAGLPRFDVAAAHALADRVAGRGNDDAWTAFSDLLGGWLNRRVRGEGEPAGGTQPGPGVAAAALATWAAAWEKLTTSTDEADELNLDRKRTVLSILTMLARATRM